MLIEFIPSFADNYAYVLSSNGKAAIVDAADPAAVERAYKELVVEKGLTLTHVLVTHHHSDHWDKVVLDVLPKNVEIVGGDDRIDGMTKKVTQDDSFKVGDASVKVFATPCHTKAHVCYFVTDENNGNPSLFCGDTLFLGGCGRFFEGDASQMHEALNQKIASLPKDTKVYCGHEYSVSNLKFAKLLEPNNDSLSQKLAWCEAQREKGLITIPSTVEEELSYNPFMRVHHNSVITALKLSTNDSNPVDVMMNLREAKNKGSL